MKKCTNFVELIWALHVVSIYSSEEGSTFSEHVFTCVNHLATRYPSNRTTLEWTLHNYAHTSWGHCTCTHLGDVHQKEQADNMTLALPGESDLLVCDLSAAALDPLHGPM